MLRDEYPDDFEEVWYTHAVGVKKLAFDQWEKIKPDAAFKTMLIDYLKTRQREDKRWVQDGKIHHLRTILSQRHWESVNYERISRYKPTVAAHADFEPTPTHVAANPEVAARALAEAKRMTRH